MDGTLIPVRDRMVGASSCNYRFSANVQVIGSVTVDPVLMDDVIGRFPAPTVLSGPPGAIDKQPGREALAGSARVWRPKPMIALPMSRAVARIPQVLASPGPAMPRPAACWASAVRLGEGGSHGRRERDDRSERDSRLFESGGVAGAIQAGECGRADGGQHRDDDDERGGDQYDSDLWHANFLYVMGR